MANTPELVANLPTGEFSKQLSLFSGPKVKLHVGDVDKVTFEVSKNLICQASKFFDRAFNEGFQEATDREMTLVDDKAVAVEALIQFIYTGKVVYGEPAGIDDAFTAKKKEFEFYLDFVILADEVDVIGSLTSIFQSLNDLLKEIKYHLDVSHFKLAFKLPAGHRVRTTMVQSCVRDYFFFMKDSAIANFVLEDILVQVDGFAVELLKEAKKTFETRREATMPFGKKWGVDDPFLGGKILFL